MSSRNRDKRGKRIEVAERPLPTHDHASLHLLVAAPPSEERGYRVGCSAKRNRTTRGSDPDANMAGTPTRWPEQIDLFDLPTMRRWD